MKIMDKSVSDEQGSLRKGRECLDQTVALRRMTEQHLEKFRYFTRCKRPKRIYRMGMWDVLKKYGEGGHLPAGIWSFNKDASPFVHINRKLSDSFGADEGSLKVFVMSPCLLDAYRDGQGRDMKAKVRELGLRLKMRSMQLSL